MPLKHTICHLPKKKTKHALETEHEVKPSAV